MVNAAVLVSGGGTNLQALLDAQAAGRMPHVRIALVVASNPQAYALQRAAKAGVEAVVCARKAYESASAHDAALCGLLQSHGIDMVVLAGFLTITGDNFVKAFPNRILNVHPALLPAGKLGHISFQLILDPKPAGDLLDKFFIRLVSVDLDIGRAAVSRHTLQRDRGLRLQHRAARQQQTEDKYDRRPSFFQCLHLQ